MKTAMPQEKKIAITLALLALVIAGALYWVWDQGMQLRQELIAMRNIPATTVPEQKILPEFNLPPVETGFPDLIARSLFAANRRSSVTPGKGSVAAMKKGQFALVGVLITPQQQSALLRDVATNKTQTIALQGIVRGLTLGEVEPARVLLRQGDETEELLLNIQTGPKLASAPRAPALPLPPAAPTKPLEPTALAASTPAKIASGPSPSASAPGAKPPPANPPSLSSK